MKTRTHFLLIALTFTFLTIIEPNAPAVLPPPDGGYPNFTTAEGTKALLHLTSGAANTGLGWSSLLNVTTGSFNTGVGAGTLALNTGDSNTATGAAALLLNTVGTENTANGTATLVSNSTGSANSAFGAFALNNNGGGSSNTAMGDRALLLNTTGGFNTATGSLALQANTVGSDNTAVGAGALESNTGSENTAIGSGVLLFNTTGTGSTATGFQALLNSTVANGNTAYGYQALSNNAGSAATASFNTAIGYRALTNQTSGVGNIALGPAAGDQITTGDDNIDIGNGGQFSDSRTTRIGQDQLATYIAAISGVNEGGSGILPVYINNLGRLGTQPPASSRRFKHDIRPMANASEGILGLKPVAFHYKDDATKTPQFGLIAEDVAEMNPDLVMRDENGEIYTVRYEAVNAMLLNEFLKEHRTVQQQGATIAELKKEIANLTGIVGKQATQLQNVSAQVGTIRSVPQLVVSDR
ncbi:MAG TPA: tail fiber domain-containing protein [Candidatus Udaeobacter sp.]